MSEILIITGLPRSGTSLMMQIIAKTEIPVLTDGNREKDINNPEGYYELDAVKSIVIDNSFLNDAKGKAIKIVAPLPIYLDKKHTYRVIFMRREMDEILRSQEKMLIKDQSSEREKYRTIYEFHLKKTYTFIYENKIPFVDVNYNVLVADPEAELKKLIDFCQLKAPLEALVKIVNPDLYRNRNEK
ncbi:MAG: sulfotransferase [Crocinitomicaceae bacterium]|nr:sulfotransferase [Crocinitomicaceae bacterium]